MWLTLLLSALDDALQTRERRAALHEVSRRLGVEYGVPPGGFRGRLDAWLARNPHADYWLTHSDRVWRALTDLLQHCGARGITWTSTDPLPVPHGVATPLDASITWWLDVLWALEKQEPGKPLSFAERGVYHDEGPTHHQIMEVMDWILMEKPNLTQYDWPSARDAASVWHRAFALCAGFGQPVAAGNTRLLARWPDGATLVQLTSRRDFADEGTSMGHCVGGPHQRDEPAPGDGHYWNSYRDGKIVIISYRDPAGRPRATLSFGRPEEDHVESPGLADLYLDEAQGPGDGPLDLIVAMRLFHWLRPGWEFADEEETTARCYDLLTQLIHDLKKGGSFQYEEGNDDVVGEATLSDLLDNDDPFSLREFGIELGGAVEIARQNRVNAPDRLSQDIKEVGAILWNLRHWVMDSYAGRLDLERFSRGVNAIAADLIKPVVGDGEEVQIFVLRGQIRDGDSQIPLWTAWLDALVQPGEPVQFTWSFAATDNRKDGIHSLDVDVERENPFRFLRRSGHLPTWSEAREVLTNLVRPEDADVENAERVAEIEFRRVMTGP